MTNKIKPGLFTQMVVLIWVEQGGVYLVTLLGMLKSASGILTTFQSLDWNSLLLVVLSTLIRQYLDPDRQKLHPIFEELAKNYGQYWSRYIQIGKAWSEETSMSPVGVPGNEAADELAGKGCNLPNRVPVS
ncbi:hypothetical protein TNCV_3261261 [Trichonephila clavipes]|nr:hypothetical protein TNCV_3261261 [Trichonephila clavipes]